MTDDRVNFFVSYAGRDRPWAEWVAWQLIDAQYTVELDVWDWGTGQNFVTAMSDALDRCDRVIALFSTAYFDRSRYTTDEWAAALIHMPGMAEGKLVPVRVEKISAADTPAVLRPLVFCDLSNVDAVEARRALLEAVTGPRRPDGEPVFPGRGTSGGMSRLGGSGPRLPGSMPRIWNVTARNPGFTGRDALLVAVRESLLRGDRAVVQALHGRAGVGKSQLAVEYAHRFAGGYDLVWWLAAEQPGLIGEQIAELASVLGCARPGVGLAAVRQAVLAELRERGRWLLVFDNADKPEDLANWLPGGNGHVLITTRTPGWVEIASPLEVDVLTRTVSAKILSDRVPGLPAEDASRVAEALGDLPLAIAQAAGYMADSGISAEEYMNLLKARAAEILDQGRPSSYQRSLAAVTQLAFDHLRSEDPAAAELAALCAFLAPEPIPANWFTSSAADLPSPLDKSAADPFTWRNILTRIGRHALARVDHSGLQMHRLTQAIVRSHLPPEQAAATRKRVGTILAASDPGDESSPKNWPSWARLLPHLLAVNPLPGSDIKLRALAVNAARYLVRRGDARTGLNLAERLFRQWRDQLGPDDEDTLRAAAAFAYALREMGRYPAAQELDEETLARRRQVLGENHTDTLSSASDLAADFYELRDCQAARELDEDTLTRRRQVLGDDHTDTLVSANNLAGDLRGLGNLQAARELDEDTLPRRRRVLGEDHPHTLTSASNLAADLRGLGDLQAARKLDEDTLARRRNVLGRDHPRALTSASNLAEDLRQLGDYSSARELDEDTLDRRRRVLGEDHPRTLTSAENLLADLNALGETLPPSQTI